MKPTTLELIDALLVGATHPWTSQAAARHAQQFAEGRLGGIVRLLMECDDGLTDHEGAAEMNLPGDTYRPLRRKLVLLGVVENSGKARETPSGCYAIVWRLAASTRGGAA